MMRMSDAQQFYVVGIHGAPTPETAPHGFRWRAATGQRWFYGDFADVPANANDQWAPLPAPPTEEAPAPEPVKRWRRWTLPGGTTGKPCVMADVTRDEADAAADALNTLEADGVVWGPGRPMEELPDGHHPRVLLRADGGPYVAANTYRSTDAEHKRLCWWPLPLPGEAT